MKIVVEAAKDKKFHVKVKIVEIKYGEGNKEYVRAVTDDLPFTARNRKHWVEIAGIIRERSLYP